MNDASGEKSASVLGLKVVGIKSGAIAANAYTLPESFLSVTSLSTGTSTGFEVNAFFIASSVMLPSVASAEKSAAVFNIDTCAATVGSSGVADTADAVLTDDVAAGVGGTGSVIAVVVAGEVVVAETSVPGAGAVAGVCSVTTGVVGAANCG